MVMGPRLRDVFLKFLAVSTTICCLWPAVFPTLGPEMQVLKTSGLHSDHLHPQGESFERYILSVEHSPHPCGGDCR